MPRHTTDETRQDLFNGARTSGGLSTLQAEYVGCLVGHALVVIECELILQTLIRHRGNRTRTAEVSGISVRSLRDRIHLPTSGRLRAGARVIRLGRSNSNETP